MMKIKVLLISLVSLFCCGDLLAQGQGRDISAQLQELKAQELEIQGAIDSLGVLLNDMRSQFNGNNSQSSETIGEQIIALEGSIFDYRSQLSLLGANIASLEARQSIIDQQSSSTTTSGASQPSSNLLDDKFFVDNMSLDDRNYFKESGRIMTEFEANISRVNLLYSQLIKLGDTYKTTKSQAVIDSIMIKAADLKEKIWQVDGDISASWGELYDRKLDNYLVLVDRLGSVDRTLLEKLDLLSRQAFATEEQAANSLAPSIISYVPQQQLLLEYETLFAEKLELQSAMDSLKKVAENFAKKNIRNYDYINYPYRSQVVYSEITLGNTYPYSEVSQVPELSLPETGVYYSIQVAVVSKLASSLSIFKGAEPLQVEKTSTGGSRYVLGGFKSYDKAAQAVKQCLAATFKNPVLVAWIDGKSTTVSKARAYQAEHPELSGERDYKIEVTTSNPEAASIIKRVIDINSAGKNISRIQLGDDFVFTIGAFVTRDEAEVIAYIIGSECGEGITTRVQTIE